MSVNFLISIKDKRYFEIYRIFRTIRHAHNPLICSKMERAPYSPVRLMCGSGCALLPSSEQILCCNKRYQRNSTYLTSFFLAIKLPTLIPFRIVFFLFTYRTLFPFTSVFFSSLYVRKHIRASRMYCNLYLAASRTLLTQCEHNN